MSDGAGKGSEAEDAMKRWNRGAWYAHVVMFDKDEREVRVLISRFHRWIPIITVWWWFGDVTFGYIGDD